MRFIRDVLLIVLRMLRGGTDGMTKKQELILVGVVFGVLLCAGITILACIAEYLASKTSASFSLGVLMLSCILCFALGIGLRKLIGCLTSAKRS